MVRYLFLALLHSLRLLLQRKDAIAFFAGTPSSARRSFLLLAIDFPFTLYLAWFADGGYLPKYGASLSAFMALRIASYALGYTAALLLVYIGTRMENCTPRYGRWLESYNWMMVLTDLLQLPVIFATVIVTSWSCADLTAMGVGLYLLLLYAFWVQTTRALEVDLFKGAGFTILPFMITGLLYDIGNLHLFGTARPFFEQAMCR